MSGESFDAVVVGASLAGCTAAVLLARAGASVALLERHANPDAHKALCTHFIQPSALPTMRRLGLDRLVEEAGGLRNPLEVYTAWGWIGAHLEAGADGDAPHGYNIRRVRLDPMLRRLAAQTRGVELRLGWTATRLLRDGDRVVGVEAGETRGERALRARLVVAADGRDSSLAQLAQVPTRSAPTCRFGVFVPVRGAARRRGDTSQMWLIGGEAAYSFPNDDGVTVLGWMAPKEALDAVRGRPREALYERFATLPDAPDLARAEPAGPPLVIKDYPNLWRAPVAHGMALVGDALTSVDYLWGVGCGWALQTGEWLADAVGPELAAGDDPEAGLARYARRCAGLGPHRMLINDFARRRTLNPIERLMFSAAAKDVRMARHLNRFGGRLDGPRQFLAPSALARAAWVNLRRSRGPADGTRTQGA
jgi:flavin-dependent dehydrogenase